MRQEVVANKEAHEDEVVDDLLEVVPARHHVPVGRDELLVQVLSQHPDLAQAEGRRPLVARLLLGLLLALVEDELAQDAEVRLVPG